MMRVIALFIAAAAFASPVYAQDAADGYPMEAQYKDESAALPKESAGDAIAAKAEPPMLLDQNGQPARLLFISLEDGQTVLFRIDDGKATDVRLVDADTAPKDGEIRASMSSMGGNTSLQVLNKGPQAYNYSAVMLPSIDANEGQLTSVCTLMPGISGFEMWPYAIPAIAIGEFTRAPDGAMTCK